MPRTLRILPSIFAPTSLRKRLWQGGIALAVLIATVAAMNRFVSSDKSVSASMMGRDFLPFYTAGTLVRLGMPDLLYDVAMIKAAEHDLAQLNHIELSENTVGPFWNPPFYALIFVPLSALTYREGLIVWTLVNVLALLGAMKLLVRMLGPDCDWKSKALVPLLICVSMPFVQAISHGQNTFTSLLLVTTVATFWRQRRGALAGAACGLLLYKPQLAMVLATVLILDLGVRALLGMAMVALPLLGVILLKMPGTIIDYVEKLPKILHFMQVENSYLWERHVTLRGFFRLMFQGRDAGEVSLIVNALTIACCLAIGGALLASLLRNRKRTEENPWTMETRSIRRDRLIAATIASTPLLMPFYFDYDLLLLAVPATLLASEWMSRNTGAMLSTADRWLFRAWCALFLWTMVNPGLAASSHINGTVVFLSGVVGLMLTRAVRIDALAPAIDEDRDASLDEPMATRRIAA